MNRERAVSERGTTIVEFAMVIPIIVMLFMGIFDLGRFFYTQATLQHAVHEATRFAVTGNTKEDGQGRKMTRAESIQKVIYEQASDLDLKVSNIVIDPADGGAPSEVVTVTANFEFGFVTPGMAKLFSSGKHDFSISTAMKNEPYTSGQDDDNSADNGGYERA